MSDFIELKRIRLTGSLYNSYCPPTYLNISRPRRYSNPFKMENQKSEKERVDVLVKFRDALKDGLLNFNIEEFVSVVERVEYEGVACWCTKEEMCHGDILIKAYTTFKKHGAWPLGFVPKVIEPEVPREQEIPIQEGLL